MRVAHEDSELVEAKLSHRIQALLAYLLLQQRRPHSREVLAGLFWGDHSQEQARNCLNTSLWRLRSVLEPKPIPAGTYLLSTGKGEIGFNRDSPHWLDVNVFQDRVGQLLSHPLNIMNAVSVDEVERALELYQGDLLEGHYDEWALREREHLRLVYLDGLARLLAYYRGAGLIDQAMACGQRILSLDPLREEIHREIMRLYLQSGKRAMAVRQYEVCRSLLEKELGIPPMEETQLLFKQVISEDKAIRVEQPVDERHTLQQALGRLRQANSAITDASLQIQHVLEGRDHSKIS